MYQRRLSRLAPQWERAVLKQIHYDVFLDLSDGYHDTRRALLDLFHDLDDLYGPYLHRGMDDRDDSDAEEIAETVLRNALDIVADHPRREDLLGKLEVFVPRFRALHIRGLATTAVESVADHPWRRCVESPPENLVETPAELQDQLAEWCVRFGLPTADGAEDLWYSYREWSPIGGEPVLSARFPWVFTSAVELPPGVKQETLYAPPIPPVPYAPFRGDSHSKLHDRIDAVLAIVRDSLLGQAEILDRHAASHGWRYPPSQYLEVDERAMTSQRTFRRVLSRGSESWAEIARQTQPKGGKPVARSTVRTQVEALATTLNIVLPTR